MESKAKEKKNEKWKEKKGEKKKKERKEKKSENTKILPCHKLISFPYKTDIL